MRNYLIAVFIIAQPWLSVFAQIAAAKDPMAYPLRQWLFVLALALFGGMASWWAKVRKGELAVHNLSALIGELAISAFVGVIAFFGCEYMNFAPLLTAAIVGISGNMGARALTMFEEIAIKRITGTVNNQGGK